MPQETRRPSSGCSRRSSHAPCSSSSRLLRRCASRSLWIALLWPTLPLLLMLARVVAPPRFPQLLIAALDLLFAHLLFFPRNPLSFFLWPALIRHASLPLSHHLRSTAHPRRRLPIYPARLPMSSPARNPRSLRGPALWLQEPPYVRSSAARSARRRRSSSPSLPVPPSGICRASSLPARM